MNSESYAQCIGHILSDAVTQSESLRLRGASQYTDGAESCAGRIKKALIQQYVTSWAISLIRSMVTEVCEDRHKKDLH